MNNDNLICIKFVNTNDILQDTCTIIDNAKAVAYTSVNAVLVERNWLIGKRIAEEEMKGEKRAQYGAQIMKQLSTYQGRTTQGNRAAETIVPITKQSRCR